MPRPRSVGHTRLNKATDNAMLILHAAGVEGNLVLWGEDSGSRNGPPTRQADGEHPHCASSQPLAEVIGLQMGDNCYGRAIAWLPTLGAAPVPSSPMAGPTPSSRAKPRIRPWTITTLRLSPEQAVPLLKACHQRRVLKPGVAIGTDLAYWTQALQLAQSITARQQFLPNLSQRDGQTIATWTPVFTGEDARRLAQLAELMPASARALSVTGATEPPTTAAQAALREFIAVQVDHLARTGAEAGDPMQPGFDSAHDAWLWALGHINPVVLGDPAQIQQLRRQVAEWQRPLAITANSPYRLCLRLEEPPELGPSDRTPAIRQDDWYLRYLLQPHHDQSLLLPAEAVWKNQVNSPDQDFNPAEFLLSSLAQAGSVCPVINDSLKGKQPAGYRLNTGEAYGFLESQAAALQQAGFGVLLPAWWTRQGTKTRPVIRTKARTPAMQGGSGMSMTSLIDLDVEMALGDEPISVQELEELAEMKVPLVRFRGQWVEINADDIQAAADFWRNRNQVTLREAMQIVLGADQRAEADNVSLIADDWLQGLLDQLQQKACIEMLTTPEQFAGELRQYQQIGYSWLAFLTRWGLGACLADDMGLGKTVQTLAALQRDQQQGNDRPNLLICPTSVINNWQREIAKFTPDLAALVHHGPGRHQGDTFREHAEGHLVVITSYGTMNRDRELLASVPWRAVILDEAQNIKNPELTAGPRCREHPGRLPHRPHRDAGGEPCRRPVVHHAVPEPRPLGYPGRSSSATTSSPSSRAGTRRQPPVCRRPPVPSSCAGSRPTAPSSTTCPTRTRPSSTATSPGSRQPSTRPCSRRRRPAWSPPRAWNGGVPSWTP